MKSFRQLARSRALTGLVSPRTSSCQNIAASQLWRRSFSATSAAASKLAELDPSKLTVTKTAAPKELLPPQELIFGKNFTGMYRFLFLGLVETRSITDYSHLFPLQITCSLSNGQPKMDGVLLRSFRIKPLIWIPPPVFFTTRLNVSRE